MQESLWKVAMFILVVILLIIYPTMALWDLQDSVVQIELIEITSEYIDLIRYDKFMDLNSYTGFVDRVNRLDPSLEIQLKHRFSYWIPILDSEGRETGQIKQAYMEKGHDEVVEELIVLDQTSQTSNQYTLQEGDWIEVQVRSSKPTKAQRLKSLFLSLDLNYIRHYVRLSGKIH